MIKFASHVIPVGQLFPKADRKKFVKIAESLTREAAIRKLAAIMHNEYVDKMKETPEYAGQDNPQRMRDDKTGSGQQINILQDFENLTPGWQEENLKAAEVAYDLVKENIHDIDNKMEEIADKIHQAWSARNKDNPLAKIIYANLPEVEQKKDKHQAKLARDLIYENMGSLDFPKSPSSPDSQWSIDGKINDILVVEANKSINQHEFFKPKSMSELQKYIKEETGIMVPISRIEHRLDVMRKALMDKENN